jgi:hypothetical protein
MHLTTQTTITRPDGTEAGCLLHLDYTPAIPGNFNGHPDTWTPDEPAEVDILAVEGEASAQEVDAYFATRYGELVALAERAHQDLRDLFNLDPKDDTLCHK